MHRSLILFVGLLSLTGCNSRPQRPAPATYPVNGEVTPIDGKLPVGAQIEFTPKQAGKGAELSAMGFVDEAGKFTLHVPYVDRVLPGAIEGKHTVRIVLPVSSTLRNTYGGSTITIPEEFTVQAHENQFKLTLPKP